MMTMTKKLAAVALLGAAALSFQTAQAHGDAAARHGGMVQTAADLSFELVGGPDGATLYIEDHGKPLASAGMGGKLTVLNGSEKSEAELKPAGDNRLEARGVRLAKGAKAVAAVTTAPQKTVTVRFAVK